MSRGHPTVAVAEQGQGRGIPPSGAGPPLRREALRQEPRGEGATRRSPMAAAARAEGTRALRGRRAGSSRAGRGERPSHARAGKVSSASRAVIRSARSQPAAARAGSGSAAAMATGGRGGARARSGTGRAGLGLRARISPPRREARRRRRRWTAAEVGGGGARWRREGERGRGGRERVGRGVKKGKIIMTRGPHSW